MKVIDTSMFFEDLELLEIRLNSLKPFVDRFVIVESQLTFANKPKPLYLQKNKDRFKDFDIDFMVYEPTDLAKHEKDDPWERCWNQLRWQMNNLPNVDPDDMVLVSDGDEIPDLRNWNAQEGVFIMGRYYYKLNGYSRRADWPGTDAVLMKNMPKDIRTIRLHHPFPANQIKGGWHFCCLGTTEEILHKYQCNAHQQYNTPENLAQIKWNIENRVHPTNLVPNGRHSRPRRLVTRMPDGPDWLLENKDKYKHLFYED